MRSLKLSFVLVGLFSLLLNPGCKKEDVDPCDNVTCLNGGVCVNGACDCPPQYFGANCEQKVDPCDGITCLNGGTCVNGQCNCLEGFSGGDCSVEETPTRIRVTRIRVTGFPGTDDNGGGWDISSGPDIYPVLEYNGSVIYKHGSFAQNATPSNTYSFTPSVNLNLNNPTDEYVIRLYDYDDFDADDYMAGYRFTPYFKGDKFPETIRLQGTNNSLIFFLDAEYSF